MARGHNRTRINREWVPKGRHERLYAVDCCVRRTRRGPGAGTGCEKMATPSHPGDRHGASTRAALVTGSMPDAPTWTETGEDSGGRSFPRKPHFPKFQRAKARPNPRTRRSEADRWCHLAPGATRRPRNAKPDKTATPNREPKKRPARAGQSNVKTTWAQDAPCSPAQRSTGGSQPVPFRESVQRSKTSSFLSWSQPSAANGAPCASTTASIIFAFGTRAR